MLSLVQVVDIDQIRDKTIRNVYVLNPGILGGLTADLV